jgi:hypothetical protein
MPQSYSLRTLLSILFLWNQDAMLARRTVNHLPMLHPGSESVAGGQVAQTPGAGERCGVV